MSLASIRQRDPRAAFAIGRTLPLEGGLVDAKADPGGITDHGVSLRYALAEVKLHPDLVKLFDVDQDGHVDRLDIAGLTQDQAADIFDYCWWQPGWYSRLFADLVAWKCFDIAVNTGPNRSGRLLQQSLTKLGHFLTVDGVVGPKTLVAANAACAPDAGAALLGSLRTEQAAFYRILAAQDPELQRQFLAGWLNRAAA